MTDRPTEVIIVLGTLMLSGLAMETLAKRIRLPRVTLLLFVGFLISPSMLNLIPKHIVTEWFPSLIHISLAMIGFLLGSKMTLTAYKKEGRHVIGISMVVVLVTFLVVFVGLLSIHTPITIAALLGSLSAATAPALTTDVVHELKAKGLFTRVLLGIVAIDDAWTLILFSITVVVIKLLQGYHDHITTLMLKTIWEIAGAGLIGVVLGIPTAYLTGRIQPGEPTLLEALGVVLLTCGIALWLHASFILTLMVLGMTVANLATHHQRAFHAIEGIEWPFMVVFFILAGSQFNINMLMTAGAMGIGYVVFRFVARIIGGWLGARLTHANKHFQHWMGLALMPQAGLTIGMLLVAINAFPELENVMLPVVLASTIVFEILGPIMTRIALLKVGDAST